MSLQNLNQTNQPKSEQTLYEGSPLPLIAIVGPTGIGKTAVAVRLCETFGGEVVSADSRQVYRGMDIGTAKPGADEQRRTRHHLIDVVAPDEDFSLAEYQRLAYAAIDHIHARGRVPFLVGGTGQYVRAVLEGWTVPRVAPNRQLRARLYREAGQIGAEALHARLAAVDPAAAARIDSRNVRRVVRALEVYETTGMPISARQGKHPPPYRVLQIGLTAPRPILYRWIDDRVDRMIAAGLVDEVYRLVEQGYSWDLPAMSGLGYAQVGQYLRGEVSLPEAVRLIKHHTRRFIRHQYNWFRPDDPAIHWFDLSQQPDQEIEAMVRHFLRYSIASW
jgi:tRNA dimethylallyltransferase